MESGPKRKPVIERFFRLINKTPSCWIWIGSCYKNGYGSFGVGIWKEGTFKNTYAHRVSYELHKGPIPIGLCVLHKCDNPPCVNPDHIWLGTTADNVRDKVNKKRHGFGEKNSQAILKEKDIIEIRKLHNDGMKQIEIAKKFPVHKGTIWQIVNRLSWKHI
jgi:hypothetical protein